MDKAGDVRLLVIGFQSEIIYKHIIANINYTLLFNFQSTLKNNMQ